MGVCGCGIQKVHFLGEENDWINIQQKLSSLKKYKLKGQGEFIVWIENLEKIIEEFIKTYRNEPNLEFWNTIIQQFDGYELKIGASGMEYYQLSNFVNGWILNFFLFDKDEEYFSKTLIDRPLENLMKTLFVIRKRKKKKKKKK